MLIRHGRRFRRSPGLTRPYCRALIVRVKNRVGRSWPVVLAMVLGTLSPEGHLRAQSPPKKGSSLALTVPFIEGRPFAEVLRRAREEKKPILVDVYATWCGPCKLMDRTTFSDPGVGAWAKKTVVAAKVDAEKGEGRHLAQRYAISSFPSVLFLDASGNEIDRLLGAFPPDSFRSNAEIIVSGRGLLSKAIEKLNASWDFSVAMSVIGTLAQRNDLPRLRPVVVRLVREDSGLEHIETLDALILVAMMEDAAGGLSAETTDMVSSFLPRLGSDVRRGSIGALLARDAARSGDLARTQKMVVETLRAVGESSPSAPDLLAALGEAQRKAHRPKEAVASFLKALALPSAGERPRSWIAERKVDVARALAEEKRRPEAEATLKEALSAVGDPSLLARGARVWLELNRPVEALEVSRRAVEATGGEDAGAQAAFGASLAASGDRKGAVTAFSRAAELAPDDREIRRELASLRKKG